MVAAVASCRSAGTAQVGTTRMVRRDGVSEVRSGPGGTWAGDGLVDSEVAGAHPGPVPEDIRIDPGLAVPIRLSFELCLF